MIQFKACPKCRGDMRVDSDMYGEYRRCLQCGTEQEVTKPIAEKHAPVRASAA